MAKRKTTQELMAQRNPLNHRAAVAPVDIYQQPAPVVEQPETILKPESKKEPKATSKSGAPKEESSQSVPPSTEVNTETDNPYSTYLYKKQVKGIKLRAIEQGVKDKHVVQQAIDEYFQNHPL